VTAAETGASAGAGAGAAPGLGSWAVPPGLRHIYSGKVRELYQTEDGVLLLVASDRISAFDYVLETPIPDKGKILTQLSAWWFERLGDIVPNHLVDAPVPAAFAGRAMACRPLTMVPVECVARGYLTGSGLADYRRDGAVCGIALPAGLADGSRLPEPIFTPASKAPRGQHDENITGAEATALVGEQAAAEIERITLAVYERGADLAAERGIIVADTKIELGFDETGILRLADEVLTPDSSRFWAAESWQPGRSQVSFDKQFVRDWLTSPASGWDRHGQEPPPPLPPDVVEQTRQAYVTAYESITGMRWSFQQEPPVITL
jgi:phosphoribosylaminoimidazole-succinocarboxamide synthase